MFQMLTCSLFAVAMLAPHSPVHHEPPTPIRLDAWLPPSDLLLPMADFDVPLTKPLPEWPCGVCSDVAFVMREAGLRAAREDYFTAMAQCVNDGGTFYGCAWQAHGDWQDAMQLVWLQHAERLQVCTATGGGGYDPQLVPCAFQADITNQWSPFVPGRTLVYRKVTDEGTERVRVTTEADTVEIAGIECRVVRDVVRLDGSKIEDTDDWYAQDANGNVWYLGEIVQNFANGRLRDVAGSWETGVDGAKAGIVMRSNPQVGDFYRQELLLGEAEDVAMVVQVGVTVEVPYGTFAGCIATEDWSPLEPGHRERKFYAPSIGFVLAITLETGERTELTHVLDD